MDIEPAQAGQFKDSDTRFSIIDIGGAWDAIFNGAPRVGFTVKEGQSADGVISVSTGSGVALLDSTKVFLRVKDENGEWKVIAEAGKGGLIDIIGIVGESAQFKVNDLPPGEYQVYGAVGGLSILTSTTVKADIQFYDHTEAGSYTATPVSGNVLDNDAAGEGAKVTHINGEQVGANGTTTFEGEYGTLTIGADGEFTYTPNNTDGSGIGRVETFDYTIKAADGSSSTATIHVRIDSDGQGLIWPEDPSLPAQVDLVANDDNGTASIDSTYKTEAGPVGHKQAGIGSTLNPLATTKADAQDTFVVGANRTYSVKVTAVASDRGSIKLTVYGPDGSIVHTETQSPVVGSPKVSFDLSALPEGSYTVKAEYSRSGIGGSGTLKLDYSGTTTYLDEYVSNGTHKATGNVLADDHLASTYTKFLIKDANGNFVEVINGTTVEGQHGTLTINTNGSYSYQPKPGLEETGNEDVFEYRLEHPNGTTADATLTVGVEHGDGPYVPEASAFNADFDEVGADESALSLDNVEDHTPETTEEPAVLEESIELQGTEETDVDLGALEDEQEQSGQAAGEPTSFEGISEEELLVPEVEVDPVIDELDEHSLVG
ncbi:Ig-like domain-containing protein [Alcaligenes faecalis]|uniref:Ig-like domain-containing protein n=1 Tax=Alcaligenes faecalis TaxID=511 RepID=UPI00190F4955|nr:Ig-like domain-containing protein [Alcaligenes faecalis]